MQNYVIGNQICTNRILNLIENERKFLGIQSKNKQT